MPYRPCRSLAAPFAITVTVLLSLWLIAVPTFAQQTSAPSDPRLTKALKETSAGHFVQAQQLYRNLLSDKPNIALAWVNLGLLQLRTGRISEAIPSLKKAAQLAPKSAPYQAELARAYAMATRWPEAEKVARRAVALDLKNRTAREILANALLATGQFQGAIPVLRGLLAEKNVPLDRPLRTNLVLALAQNRQWAEAMGEAQTLAKKYPQDVSVILLEGDLWAQQNRYDKARVLYAKANALDTRSPGAVKAALAAEMGGQRETALALLRERISKRAEDADAHFHLGRILYSDEQAAAPRRFRAAEDEFAQAVHLSPRNPMFRTNLALSQLYQGGDRVQMAQHELEGVVGQSPEYTPAQLALGYVLEMRGNRTSALTIYQTLLKRNPNEYTARRHVAGLLYEMNQHDAAYREFAELAALFPKDVVALNEAASLMVADKQLRQAEAVYREALSRDPKNARSHVGLGQIKEVTGLNREAEQEYKAAIAASPQESVSYLALAALQEKTGNLNEAAGTVARLVAVAPDNNIARWQLSQYYQQLKRDDDAMREMRAIRFPPNDPNRLAYQVGPATLLMRRERYKEAIAELQPLLQSEPNRPELRFVLAEAYEKAGDVAAAEATLKGAGEQQGSDFRAVLYRAHLYQRHGRDVEAKTLFTSVVDGTRIGSTGGRDYIPVMLARADALEGLSRNDEAVAVYRDILKAEPNNAAAKVSLERLSNPPSKPVTTTNNPKPGDLKPVNPNNPKGNP